jgi:hypothetical protein
MYRIKKDQVYLSYYYFFRFQFFHIMINLIYFAGVFLLGKPGCLKIHKKVQKFFKIFKSLLLSSLIGTIFGCTHAGVTNCWVGVGSSGGPQSADLTVKQACKSRSEFCYVSFLKIGKKFLSKRLIFLMFSI